MSVNWLLKIVDGASGPMRAATAAARQLRAAMNALNGAGGDLAKVASAAEKAAGSEGRLNKVLAEQIKLRDKIATPKKPPGGGATPSNGGGSGLGALQAIGTGKGLGGGLEALVGAPSGALSGYLSLVGSILSTEIAIAEKAVSIAAQLAIAGGELAIQATSARNMSIDVLNTFTQSQAASDAIYQDTLRLSEKLGAAPEAVFGRMKKLLSAGLSPSDIAPAITAIENATVGISAKAGAALDKSITKIAAKGFMDNRALTQLAGAGINVQKIYEALAQQMGKKVKDVELLTRKGKINATDAIKAIEQVVNEQSGGLAQKRGASIPGLALAIGTELKDAFSHVDISPVQGALSNLLKVFQGPGGDEFKSSISSLFGTLFHTLFDQFTGAEGQERLTRLLHDISQAANNASDVIKTARPAIRWLIKNLTSSNGKGGTNLVDTIHEISTGVLDLIGVATGLGPLGEFLDMIQDYELDTSAIDGFIDSIKNVSTQADELVEEFKGMGEDLIDGLVSGIEDNTQAVIDAVVGAVSSAIGAAKSALGIASPSKVFEGIGDFTAEGFAQGIERSDAPDRAVDSMVSPPQLGSPGGSGAGGSSKQVTFDIGGINVESKAQHTDDSTKDIVRQLRAELEAMAQELGA